jgi:hypothetical protein
MKVLLLHTDDELPVKGNWDLIADLGRAPASRYREWQREHGPRVVSIYDYAEEVTDLHRIREILAPGLNRLVDQAGVDWWDIFSLWLIEDLQQLLLAERLAKELGPKAELHATGRSRITQILGIVLGTPVVVEESAKSKLLGRIRRYPKAVAQLDRAQLMQVVQDKFDRQHSIRRRLAPHSHSSKKPRVLLPTAYINVSRAAAAYASMLPEEQFLLVWARRSGRLQTLPANVQQTALDSYFQDEDPQETQQIVDGWLRLKRELIAASETIHLADKSGVLDSCPDHLRWGIAVRSAWNQLFQAETITACLCADDSNPYSRIPLILAKNRNLPTVACHHGALDFRMAIKRQHADAYLVKSQMERDYLVRQCAVAPDPLVLFTHSKRLQEPQARSRGDSMVFFTEPYGVHGWRTKEIYRELLPPLMALSTNLGLELVFKLHPFESVKAHRRLLHEIVGSTASAKIRVLGGAPAPEVWDNIRFAMTVQSTVAMESTERGVPVFLCAWLRDPYTGYVPQFARFGMGHALESIEQIKDIPQFLEHGYSGRVGFDVSDSDTKLLHELLSGAWAAPRALGA